MYIYLASSWRNKYQKWIIEEIRAIGLDVYDFTDPEDNGGTGFQWSEIDPNWEKWNNKEFFEKIEHQIAKNGFQRDMDALNRSDIVVLLMPCGRSAHLELGYAVGKGKKTAILILDDSEPELMYNMVNKKFHNLTELQKWLKTIEIYG